MQTGSPPSQSAGGEHDPPTGVLGEWNREAGAERGKPDGGASMKRHRAIHPQPAARRPRRWPVGTALLLAWLAGWCQPRAALAQRAPAPVPAAPDAPAAVVRLPQASWQGAGIEIAPVTHGPIAETVRLTGKVMLNEDRLAHVYPLVTGRVDEVKIRFGAPVRAGDVLVVVQSTEVGDAKLALFQARQRQTFVEARHAWQAEVVTNTRNLVAAIQSGRQLDTLGAAFRNQPMGDAREKLMTAYAAVYRSSRDVERLRPLSTGGVIASKQLLTAETQHTADEAALQALCEQIEQDQRQAALVSEQAVAEARTTVAVAEKRLEILGFSAAEIDAVDPASQGESLAHYHVTAPFDGTIISKDVVLQERVGPEKQIFSIADLSSVWIAADVFEQHLPLLRDLAGTTVTVRADAWPDRTFAARVFYTGDIIDEESRTIAMRAEADNAERRLHPGMFVTVEFPGAARVDALQVPPNAIQEHAGKSFVFVHLGDDRFARRDVRIGAVTPRAVAVVAGLAAGDAVVTAGGFTLKSRLLADLLEGD